MEHVENHFKEKKSLINNPAFQNIVVGGFFTFLCTLLIFVSGMIYQNFSAINERIDRVEARIDKVDSKIDKVNERLDKVIDILMSKK
jgi:hypothetical protein